MTDDVVSRMRELVSCGQLDRPIISDDSISIGDISDLLEEIDRLTLEVETERRRLGDECDRLVIEWADYLRETEEKLKTYESAPTCKKCGQTMKISWTCEIDHGD